MAKVSISEAARMAGIARSTLYRVYITTGKISIEKDHLGKPVIDSSELLRVFPELSATEKQDNLNQLATVEEYTKLQSDVERLEALLQAKTEELGRAIEEIGWLRKKVDAMEQKLLAGPETKRRWWWPW